MQTVKEDLQFLVRAHQRNVRTIHEQFVVHFILNLIVDPIRRSNVMFPIYCLLHTARATTSISHSTTQPSQTNVKMYNLNKLSSTVIVKQFHAILRFHCLRFWRLKLVHYMYSQCRSLDV